MTENTAETPEAVEEVDDVMELLGTTHEEVIDYSSHAYLRIASTGPLSYVQELEQYLDSEHITEEKSRAIVAHFVNVLRADREKTFTDMGGCLALLKEHDISLLEGTFGLIAIGEPEGDTLSANTLVSDILQGNPGGFNPDASDAFAKLGITRDELAISMIATGLAAVVGDSKEEYVTGFSQLYAAIINNKKFRRCALWNYVSRANVEIGKLNEFTGKNEIIQAYPAIALKREHEMKKMAEQQKKDESLIVTPRDPDKAIITP